MAENNPAVEPDATAAAEPTYVKVEKKKFDFKNLNTLAVVSLASAVTGFGAVAGVITGHVSLKQLKESNESGRGLAIAGVVVGYVVIGFWVLSSIFWAAAGIWGLSRLDGMYGNDMNGMGGGFGFGFGPGDMDGDHMRNGMPGTN
ncbi:MAG: hypothetical protein RLZZ229_52 [Actinomycetota bacterium]|jgi:hypothetical protein